ncbi:MAG: GNAT family N-acetyltransferase, partial [Candidatus Cloacimonetes bacterium]|nr:GNAT family N-acetyltransferase [Candidatus Cloacimonadota bacterium]
MNLSNLKIRDFEIEEYDILIELWEKTGLPYRPLGRDSKENISKQIEKPNIFFLFVEIEDKIIGSIIISHDGRKGWINRVAILSEYRNLGIASYLIDDAEKRLKKIGINIVASLIEDWNLKSLKLFDKL